VKLCVRLYIRGHDTVVPWLPRQKVQRVQAFLMASSAPAGLAPPIGAQPESVPPYVLEYGEFVSQRK
jgi:hypothetical protein